MSESIIRLEARRDFTVLPNGILRDKRVSLKTKGLFAVMLSRPGSWQFSVSGLAAFTGVGRDAIRSALKELRETGYLTMEKQAHDQGGKFGGSVYILHEESTTPCAENPATVGDDESPQPGFPSTAEPTTDKPSTGNPTQVNTDLVSTEIVNTPLTPQGGEKAKEKKKSELPDEVKQTLRAYVGDDGELARALADLMEVRTALKAVNSLRAIRTLLNELDRLSGGRREDKLLLLRQSVTNSWKSVFPLRGGGGAGSAVSTAAPTRVLPPTGVAEW